MATVRSPLYRARACGAVGKVDLILSHQSKTIFKENAWFIACFQSGSTPQPAVMLPSARKISFVAASSLGKWLRVLIL
jgi:hypothetical protein